MLERCMIQFHITNTDIALALYWIETKVIQAVADTAVCKQKTFDI